jgi:hypothetical protein
MAREWLQSLEAKASKRFSIFTKSVLSAMNDGEIDNDHKWLLISTKEGFLISTKKLNEDIDFLLLESLFVGHALKTKRTLLTFSFRNEST